MIAGHCAMMTYSVKIRSTSKRYLRVNGKAFHAYFYNGLGDV